MNIGSDIADPRAVLKGFSEVGGGDLVAAAEVGDGTRELEDAVVGAGGELELVHGGTHEAAAGFIEGAKLAHLCRVHIGVGSQRCTGKTRALHLAGGFHALRDRAGGFSKA